MALKRMAVWRIDANAVAFPRMMLLSRVQPKFKACAQAGGAGPSLSQGESLPFCFGLCKQNSFSKMKATHRIY